MKTRLARGSTAALLGLTVVALVAAIWLAAAQVGISFEGAVPEPTGAFPWLQCVAALVWAAAAVVLLRRPEIGWAPLCAAAAASHALAAASYGWAVQAIAVDPALPGAAIGVWLVGWTLPVDIVALSWLGVTVPDARLPKGYLRWPAVYTVAAPTLAVVLSVLAELDVAESDFGDVLSPLGGGLPIPAVVPILLIAPTALTGMWVVVVRWRRATGTTRLAMRTVVVISATGLLIPFLFAFGPEVGVGAAQILSSLQLLALIAVVLRHQMFGIDTVLERTLAYTMLTGLLLALYVALVALSDLMFGRTLPAVAAVAVALLALPIRDLLGRATTRLVFGDRDRPQDVVEAVARRAADAGPPEEMLSDVLHEVASRLRLSELSVRATPGGQVLAGIGEPDEDGTTALALVHRGRDVGVLVAGPRAGEDRLEPADRDALERLAPQVAAVVDAATTTIALRASRDRLVHVREEERRRLRRDLHDGLGPGLTGIALTIDAARNTVGSDSEHTDHLLAGARAELTEALAEIRRLVEDLRPPALDDLGLAGSIRQHAHRFPMVTVSVDDDGTLSDLPAAVEVAAYRIATEALTNTARHSGARHAEVSLRTNGAFEVEITDDGASSTAWAPGVGLSSMHDRAAEVGGAVVAGPADDGGGRVLARFPVDR